ncbi:hypothetical protein GCM10007301_15020 [Azorhizobium oxalatiphilum]|uniref:Uncharacterized protein n=1 Tax=Azorhizobium oxalatiphilum TaxID=980631 RepID=A0A917F7T1_9HYPH|nr:hypothetical protein [Azorhizobium oxalatiphilum]GGF56377.1 hypothetical protein GCM10007301_15020 [Azorhizobium oxalatiphilum]
MTSFHGIERAFLLIALDNGGINRDRSAEQVKAEIATFLAKEPPEMLADIDAWLAGLTTDQLEQVCCGEVTDQAQLIQQSPPFTNDLLNRYFDEVC